MWNKNLYSCAAALNSEDLTKREVKIMRLNIWDPFREMAALQRAVNSLSRDVTTRGRVCYPPVELVDKGDSIVITAELPGVSKDEVDLTVLGDTLTIAGEKKLPAEEGVNYIRHERPHGRFRRLVDLPYSVDQEKISASYKDGILTITLPKAEEAKPRQITVE
jgi:HSP20 family protein